MRNILFALALGGCVDAAPETSTSTEAERGTLRVTDWRGEVHEVTVVNENGRAIYEGDIDLGLFSRTRFEALAAASLSKRWAGNTVRYQFRQRPAGCPVGDTSCSCATITQAVCDDLTTAEKTAIRSAMDEYTRRTGIEFEESNTQPFVALTGWDEGARSRNFSDDANQNSGFVRLIAFSKNVVDPMDPNKAYRTAIHELGHTLGLSHEQKRDDAGTAMTLFPVCMTETEPFDGNGSGVKLSPFDLDSMMMYQSFSFSRGDNGCDATKTTNCCPTMLGKAGSQTTFTYTNDTGAQVSVNFDGQTFSIAAGASRQFTGHILDRTTDFSAEDLNALHQMYPRTLGQWEAGDRFGAAAVTGDFNNDGYRDLAVAAPHEGAFGHPTSGAVFIYRGTFTGLAPWTMVEADSTGATSEAGDRFGAGLAAADLDGDGDDELIVGAPNKRTNGTNRSGGVYVFDGGRDKLTLRDHFFPNDLGFGNGVADDFGLAIDVGKEAGATRVFVGSPGVSSDSGRVYVLRYDASAARHNESGTGTLVSTARWGEQQLADNRFGSALVSGQLDGDGDDELVVGAPGASGGGKIFVFKGGSSLTSIGSIVKPGSFPTGNEQFGRALELGRFRSTTGKKQIVVSAPWESTGRAYVLDVTATASAVTLDASSVLSPSLPSAAEFGYDLAVGDLDGNGLTDLAIGAPEASSGAGAVFVHRGTGNTSLVSAPVGGMWASYSQPSTHGTPGLDDFGRFVAIGNFDDKTSALDLAVGAPSKTRSGESEAGGVWLLHGRAWPNPPEALTSDQTFTSYVDENAQPQK